MTVHNLWRHAGAFAVAVAVSSAASAAWVIDDSGVGFVGKGDVQLAFGWNNAQLQRNADGVTFAYVSTEDVSWDCEFDTGNPANPRSVNHHVQTRRTVTSVMANVAYDARKNKTGQITGFNLLGFGASDTTTSGPALYSCPNGGFNLEITNVQTTSVDGGSLTATHAGTTVTLAEPAI